MVVGAVAVAVFALLVAVLRPPSVIQEMVGASPGPDRFNQCESRDGITQCFTRKALNTATTTACSIKSPTATSTLVLSSIKFTTGSTTAAQITIAQGAVPSATTTSLGIHTLAANAEGVFLASTSPAFLANPVHIFGPNRWLNISMTGGVGTFSPVGVCQATFEVI